jgi:hypothetical protein
MASMFYDAWAFDQDISGWDVSNVLSLGYMFYHAYSFNQPLGSWATGNATDINKFLEAAVSFRQPLDGLDFSSASPLGLTAAVPWFVPGSTDLYDDLLVALDAGGRSSLTLAVGTKTKFSYTGATARAALITKGWTVSDGATADCTFSSSTGLLCTYVTDRPTATRVQFKTDTTLPTGLTAGVDYWTIRVSNTTAKLATSLANAIAGTYITYTDAGTGNHACMWMGHKFTGNNSSGVLRATLATGGDLSFSGWKVRFVTSNTLPTGLSTGTDYWLRRMSATSYQIYTTAINAMNNVSPISYTDAGTGYHEMLFQA